MPVNRNLNFIVLLSLSLIFVLVFLNLYFFPWLKKFPTQGLCKECNIVIIDIDVLRDDAIDCLNNRENTPNICKLASQSITFTNNTSQALFTKTSNVSMLTSTYPVVHKVWSQLDEFNSDLPTLTEILRSKGYATYYYGQLNDMVSAMNGFEKQIPSPCTVCSGFSISNNVLPENIQTKFFAYIYLDDLHFPYLLKNNRRLPNYHRSPDGLPTTIAEYNEMMADYLAKNYRRVFKDEYIKNNSLIFNDPIGHKQKIFELVTQEGKEKYSYLKDIAILFEEPFFARIDAFNKSHVDYLKQSYLLILNNIDRSLGSFLEILEQKPLADNTIVILRSDHGEEFMEHGQFSHHNDLYQEIIRTPLIIRIPGYSKKVVDDLTMDIDIMPTVLEELGIKVPDTAEGISLLPLILGGKSERDYQISQQGDDDDSVAFRKGDWKIIVRKGTPTKLYDLVRDPFERANLISAKLGLARQLYQDYRAVIDLLPQYGQKNKKLPNGIDSVKLQRLKKEGYF